MRRALELLAALALAALAVALVFESGSRGFFPLDQSNVFEGGYRLLRGQVPYRDFLMPVGPLSFVIQVPFFLLFGVTNRAQLLHAGVVNAAAALLAVLCVKRLFPRARVPAYLAGVVTAAWFYPVFGTPAFDQTAFFFHLAALVVLLPALLNEGAARRANGVCLASGFLSGLAFFSKQNAGALSVACLLLVIVVAAGERRSRLALWFLAGLVSCAAGFGLWLVIFSDPAAFLRHFLVMPIAEGLRRATSTEFRAGILADMRSGGLSLALVLLGPLIGLTALALHWVRLVARRPPRLAQRTVLAFSVSLSLGLFQWLFIRVTSNLPDNAFGFAGLADVLALLAAYEAFFAGIPTAAGSWLRAAEAGFVALVALPLAFAGRDLARSRQVHDYWFEIHYRNAPVSRALDPARWSARQDDPRAIRVEDVDALVDYLRLRGAPFFVFPDLVALYGLTGVEPPQPLVWFHRGLTYPTTYDAELDRRVVRELERHGVRYVVIEGVSFLGTEKRLSHFPLLRDYLGRFREARRFGIFEVREKTD